MAIGGDGCGGGEVGRCMLSSGRLEEGGKVVAVLDPETPVLF